MLAIAVIIVIAIGIAIYMTSYKPGETRPTPQTTVYPREIMDLIENVEKKLVIHVNGFDNLSRIPSKYTCDGGDYSPEIIIDNIPNGTVSLAIILYDPDAPHRVFYHWIIYDIHVNGSHLVIPENMKPDTKIGYQTINDFNKRGYGGPCPPPGDKPHKYVFLVLALDKKHW